MKKTLIIFIQILLISNLIYCQEESATVSYQACDKDNRSGDCPAIYQPVCGFGGNNKVQKYSNGCSACTDTEIYGFQTGECTEEQLNQEPQTELKMKKCEESERGKMCTQEMRYPGYCGHFAKKDDEGQMFQVYGTECQACSDANVIFWVSGNCEDLNTNTNSALQVGIFSMYMMLIASLIM